MKDEFSRVVIIYTFVGIYVSSSVTVPIHALQEIDLLLYKRDSKSTLVTHASTV